MLLTGTFKRSVDEKQRIAIPKRLRPALVPADAKGLYIAPGTDGSLAIYSEASFAALAHQLADNPPTAQDVRAFSRLFFAQAQYAEVDNQGRVRVPPDLAALAELQSEVVMIGVGDRLEVWNSQRWDQYLGERQSQYDKIAEKAFGQG